MDKLFTSIEKSIQLIDAGIHDKSFFQFVQNNSNPENWKLAKKGEMVGYDTVPAWTKQEIDAMIGHNFPKPDLVHKSLHTRKSDNLEYSVHYLKGAKLFLNGADASADFLLHLLEKKELFAVDCNERHEKIFEL